MPKNEPSSYFVEGKLMLNQGIKLAYILSSTIFFFKMLFLTRECAHAHERVIAIMAFSLGRLVGWLVRLLTFGHAQ